jgi:two-component system cell cycle sensor histidine kinase/response regulator CckA
MATLSIARPAPNSNAGNSHAPATGPDCYLPLLVAVDTTGAIQSLDGNSSYYCLLARLCADNPGCAGALSAGIRAVDAGQVDNFSLEFPAPLSNRKTPMRLVAAPFRQGALEGVLLEQVDRDDSQSPKMEALGRLAGGVAHDFANLVTLISGYCDILLNRMGPRDSGRPELEEIRKAVVRGAGVTAQLLDFLRKQVAHGTLVQLNALVSEMLGLLRPVIGEHIQLAAIPDPNLGLLEADAAQMTRVIMNLVLNARDAMPGGGSIAIRTANVEIVADSWHPLPPGPYVMLEVSDTGSGMDRETLRQIFQPFFSTKRGGGTGLGLSTVQRIVEQAGGGIRAHSEPGLGTTFTICLPRAGRDRGIAVPPSLQRASGGGTGTILLAEDEESVRKLLKHFLEAMGYRVLEAADGHDALRIFELQGAVIDLLLTDVIMPGMHGPELARRALADKPSLKVVYMSGYTDDMLSNTGALSPGISFLPKPLKLATPVLQ